MSSTPKMMQWDSVRRRPLTLAVPHVLRSKSRELIPHGKLNEYFEDVLRGDLQRSHVEYVVARRFFLLHAENIVDCEFGWNDDVARILVANAGIIANVPVLASDLA